MKRYLHYIVWVFVVSLWTMVCFILPDFFDSPVQGWRNVAIQAIYWIAFGIGAFFATYLVGVSRYVNCILLPIWAILGAALSFYRLGYHVTLTPMLIDVIIHTNSEEATGVLSWQLFCWIAINLLLAIGFVIIRFKLKNPPHRWAQTVVMLAIGSTYLFSNGRLHASLCHHYPYNVPYAIHTYASVQHTIRQERIIPQYAQLNIPDSIDVVLVLGEAVRSDHLQLNGYERETTPLLARRKNIISFPYIHTEQTHTAASLPYILTRADSVNEQYQFTETSFVSIFRKEEFYTAWMSNQDMGSSFARFLTECDTVSFANAGKSVYIYSQWLDEDLIGIYRTIQNEGAGRTLSIFHPIGSHWYYNNHVPEDKYFFTPVTTDRVVRNNTNEQLVNSYDNTIRYMDLFLDSIITILQHRCAIVIYQSDHGEALGENGYYLHANDAMEAKIPACIVWYSEKYAELYPEKVQALHANKDKYYRTDYLFYSILYAVGIQANGDSECTNIFK